MAQLADETASQIISRVEQNLDVGLAMQFKNVADRLLTESKRTKELRKLMRTRFGLPLHASVIG